MSIVKSCKILTDKVMSMAIIYIQHLSVSNKRAFCRTINMISSHNTSNSIQKFLPLKIVNNLTLVVLSFFAASLYHIKLRTRPRATSIRQPACNIVAYQTPFTLIQLFIDSETKVNKTFHFISRLWQRCGSMHPGILPMSLHSIK